jgi:hypothetical protein
MSLKPTIFLGGMLLSTPYLSEKALELAHEKNYRSYKTTYLLMGSVVLWPVSLPYYIFKN